MAGHDRPAQHRRSGAAPERATTRPLAVVMGVSGSGKTTIGEAIAAALDLPFADADDFHPAANVAKMRAGIPLTDADRGPWLATVGDWLASHTGTGAVVACSALKVAYRDILRGKAPATVFVHLDGAAEVVSARVGARKGHYMPASLVASQYADLQPLRPDEAGIVLDFDDPVARLVEQATAYLRGRPANGGR